MLNHVQLRYLVCFFGSVFVAAVTALSGGSFLQIMLAPLGGIALGLATAKTVLGYYKLPATATYGEAVEAQKSKTKKA
jgi:hypothetical protein